MLSAGGRHHVEPGPCPAEHSLPRPRRMGAPRDAARAGSSWRLRPRRTADGRRCRRRARRDRGDRRRSGLAQPAGAGGGRRRSTPSRTASRSSCSATATYCRPWPPAGTRPSCWPPAARVRTPTPTAAGCGTSPRWCPGSLRAVTGTGASGRGRPGREPLPLHPQRSTAPVTLALAPLARARGLWWRRAVSFGGWMRSRSGSRSGWARGSGSGPTTRTSTRNCWPTGDRRNVVDRYRYWRHEAIVADLDTRRHDFHVAIENWQHDLNIGTVVRNANAFLAAGGAHRRSAAVEPARRDGHRPVPARAPPRDDRGARRLGHRRRPVVVGVDNLPGAVPLETVRAAAPMRAAVRSGGAGVVRAGPGGGDQVLLDRAVRLDPLDQRRAWPAESRCTPGSASTLRHHRARRRDPRQNDLVRQTCPRCDGPVRAPDLIHTEWRCDRCGPVAPLHVAAAISADVLAGVQSRVLAGSGRPAPLWCPWPLLPGWTVTGVAWAGDERDGPRATGLALSGPAPLGDGPADVVVVAEEPGIGLANALAGVPGLDPGLRLAEAAPDAKVRADGHPTPLWAVAAPPDRSTYVGEARTMWLYVIAWPAEAGYVLAEEVSLCDLVERIPANLVFGAPTRRLSPLRTEE